MDLGEDKVQILRAFKSTLLAQVNISVKLTQNLEQTLMGRQVQV